MATYHERNPWRKPGEPRNYHGLAFQDSIVLVDTGDGSFAGDCIAKRSYHVIWPDQSEHHGEITFEFALKALKLTVAKFGELAVAERQTVLDDYATPRLNSLLKKELAKEPGHKKARR